MITKTRRKEDSGVSQTADITESYLVDKDAVILSDKMLEMAWESEEEKRVERDEDEGKGDK